MPRIIDPFQQYFKDGKPLSGGKLFFYQSGSSTVAKNTYSDSAQTTSNTNPLILDSQGRVSDVWGSGTYRVIVKDANDVQVEIEDPVGGNNAASNASDYDSTLTYSKGDIVKDGLIYYKSKTNDNTDNTPSTSTANWIPTPSKIVTVITASNAAWTPNELTTSIHMYALGAGAGGGSVDGQGSGTAANSTGGGPGGYTEKFSAVVDATYNITIGIGGPGGAAGSNSGVDGGDTTVVSFSMSLTAGGGVGGGFMVGSAASAIAFGGQSGSSLGGDINGKSVSAVLGRTLEGVSLANNKSGYCPRFGGGVNPALTATGTDATEYGEGGSGVSVGSTTNYAGGDGFQGVVIVTEYL